MPGTPNEDSGLQRKRIPVACGRCRKRKIRCSGDNGNGEPCTNCRNAGLSVCQFLRVSSQEAEFKNKGNLSYGLDDHSGVGHAGGLSEMSPHLPPALSQLNYDEHLHACNSGSADTFPSNKAAAGYGYPGSNGGRDYIQWAPHTYCDTSGADQPGEAPYPQGLYAASYVPQADTKYLPGTYSTSQAHAKSLPTFTEAEAAGVFGFPSHGSSVAAIAGSSPGTASTATLAHRPGTNSVVGASPWFHRTSNGQSSNSIPSEKIAGAAPAEQRSRQYSYGRNDSVASSSSYSRSSSPTRSRQDMIPGYIPGGYENPSPSSSLARAGGVYPVSTAPSSNSDASSPYQPSTYVYTDTSAAAFALHGLRGSTGSPHQAGHPYTIPSFALSGDLGDGGRDTSGTLRR